MDAVNLRRKDTTKGPPLRILSLGMYMASISPTDASSPRLTDQMAAASEVTRCSSSCRS